MPVSYHFKDKMWTHPCDTANLRAFGHSSCNVQPRLLPKPNALPHQTPTTLVGGACSASRRQSHVHSRRMVEIVEITEETCGDCEDFEIERTWRSLKHEDAAQTVKALTIFRAVPTIVLAAPMPSPVRRNAEVRLRRSASPTWVDGIFAEMKQSDAQHGRVRRTPTNRFSPKHPRWSVEEVASALGSCEIGSHKRTTTVLGSWLPPSRAQATPQNSPQTSRLVRYAKRQQERSDARRNAVNARRAAGEASHEQLALLESMLGKVGLMATK